MNSEFNMSMTQHERPTANDQLPDLAALAIRLREARRPLFLVGRGVLWSRTWQSIAELARSFPSMRVATTPGAKGCFPETNPQSVGVLGFGGRIEAAEALVDSDLVFVLGTRLLEQSSLDWHSRFGQPGVFRFDVHARRLAAAWRNQVAVEGDLRDILPALARLTLEAEASPPLSPSSDLPVKGGIEVEPPLEGVRLKPQMVVAMVGRALHTPVCADAGNSMCWALQCLRRDVPRTFYVSLDWGTMGFALPAAIGVALATRKHVVALTGDGSMAMAGGELHTAVEHRLPVVVVVLNDSGAGMVRAGMTQWFSELPELPGLSYVNPMDLSSFGASLGAAATRVRTANELEVALAAALLRPTPTVIDVIIDVDEIPRAILDRVAGLRNGAQVVGEGGGIC